MKKFKMEYKSKRRFSTLSGLACVFDILPSRNYDDYYRSTNVEERLSGYWSRSAEYLNKAVIKYERS